MTDTPSQKSPYYNTSYRLLNLNQYSLESDDTSQDLAKRSEGEHELDLLNSLPTHQPSQLHQPLQGDQCSSESDEIYEDLTMPELNEDEHELDPIINVNAQQRNTNQLQELIQGDYDETNQGMKMKGAELDNVKAAIKKIKMALIVTVIVNIVLLFLVTVIIGSIQGQSRLDNKWTKVSLLS